MAAPRSSFPTMIRIFPAADPSGFPSMSAAPAISIVPFEGGAGECPRKAHFKSRATNSHGPGRQTVRRELLKQADVHTLLRLPTGILIRSLPLAQPLGFPVSFFAPSEFRSTPRRQGECPVDSFA